VLLLWLAAQLAAIALAVLRVPLWARAPIATELYSLQFLLVAQFAISTLTFPWLLTSWRSLISVIATGWGFLFLAAMLSPAPFSTTIYAAVHLGIWLIALAALLFPLRPTNTTFSAVAVLSTWVCGGPIWLFIHCEYNSSHQPLGFLGQIAGGPLVAGLSFFDGKMLPAFATSGLGLAISVAVTTTSRLIRSKNKVKRLVVEQTPGARSDQQ
jgi:hypothetical protein